MGQALRPLSCDGGALGQIGHAGLFAVGSKKAPLLRGQTRVVDTRSGLNPSPFL